MRSKQFSEDLHSVNISLRTTVMGVVLWAGAAYGILLFERTGATWSDEHSMCGPWGCGPQLSALIAWHGLWFVLFAPAAVFAIRYWPANWLHRIGWPLMTVGLLALAGIAIWQAIDWLPRFQPGQRTFFVRRCAFVVATLTDIPIVPATLAGLALGLGAWRKGRRSPHGDKVRSSGAVSSGSAASGSTAHN